MPGGELHELSVTIGEIQAELRIVARTVRENQEQATEEHRTVHDIVVAMSESVRNLTAKVAEMKPLTDDYREKRAEARGAARLAKLMYAAALALGSAVGSGAVWLFNFLLTAGRHH